MATRSAQLLVTLLVAALGLVSARTATAQDPAGPLGRATPAQERARPGPTQLRFVFSASDERERETFLALVNDFNASHPDVQVLAIPKLWQGFAIHDSYMRLLAMEDPSIDVLLVDLPWIPEFAWSEWLLPLDARIDEELERSFVEASLRGGRYRGRQYGLPLSLKGNALFYRRDLLEKHGLEPPRTLAEVERQARLLQEREGLPVGVALHGFYFYNDVLPMLWASRGGVLLAQDEQRPTVALHRPENVAVVQALARWFEPGPEGAPAVVPPERFTGPWARDYRAPLKDFVAGEAPFAILWSSRQRLLEAPGAATKGRIGVSTVPGLSAGAGSSNLGVYYFSINRASRHPDAAFAFIRHMTSPRAERALLEGNGEIPARWDVLNERREAGEAEGAPHLAALREVLVQGRARPRVPNERQVGQILEAALRDAVLGRQEAEAALKGAHAQIEAAMLPPPLEWAPMASSEALVPYHPVRSAATPLLLGLGLVALIGLLVGLVFWLRERLGGPVLTTLAQKFVLVGVATIVALVVLVAGAMMSHALREQQWTRRQNLAFYQEQMRQTGLNMARNLAMSASLIADQSPAGEGEASAAARGQDDGLRRLMFASHLSQDLVLLQIVAPDGRILYSERDALFGDPAAPPPTIDAKRLDAVRRRRIVDLWATEPGGESYLEVLVPIFERGVHLGALRLGLSQGPIRARLEASEARYQEAIRDIVGGTVALTLVLSLLGGLVMVLLSRSLTRPIEELTDKAEKIRRGDLSVVFSPASEDELGTLTRALSAMVQGLRDRDFIQDAFGRFVTPELVERFMTDPSSLKLGGRLQEVTIMMSDLRGFTRLAADLGPEETVYLLNAYLGRMSDVILKHDGTINEFLGDGILVLFGAPEGRPSDPERAARCAIAMQIALAELNREHQRLHPEWPPLLMGIGINTGPVVAGNIGSEQRVKYGVVGDPVNMTGRIESLTVGSQILISEATRAQIAEVVEVAAEPIRVSVKGREAPLVIHELLGVASDPPLRLPDYDDLQPSRVWLPVPLRARLRRVEGKQVGDAAEEARIRALSTVSLLLDGVEGLKRLDNLVLTFEFEPERWTEDLYAKVTGIKERGVVVTLTSVDPDDRRLLAELSGR